MNFIRSIFAPRPDPRFEAVIASHVSLRKKVQEVNKLLDRSDDPFLAFWAHRNPRAAGAAFEAMAEQDFSSEQREMIRDSIAGAVDDKPVSGNT